MRKRLPWILLVLSVATNLALLYPLLSEWINAPAERVGLLTRDIQVRGPGAPPFRLPAGLAVRDATPRGFAAAGQFEPYRFSIIVTSDDGRLVDFSVPEKKTREFREYCPAEVEPAAQ